MKCRLSYELDDMHCTNIGRLSLQTHYAFVDNVQPCGLPCTCTCTCTSLSVFCCGSNDFFCQGKKKAHTHTSCQVNWAGRVLYTFVMLLFQFWFHAHVNGWHARLRITLFVTKEFMKLLLCHAAAQLSNFQALTWSVCRAGEAGFWRYFDPRKKPVRFLRCCHCSGRNLALQSYCAVNFGVCAFVLFIKKCAWVSRNTGRWFVNIVKKQFTLLTAHTTNSINCDLLCRSTKQHVNSPAVFELSPYLQ